MGGLEHLEKAVADLAVGDHGAFCRRELQELGMSRQAIHRRVKTGRWIELLPGVYRLRGSRVSWRMKVMAAVKWAGPNAAASHRCAAALLGIMPFGETTIEIVTDRKLVSPVGWLTVRHAPHLTRRDWRYVDSIPTTTIERTLVDLCAVADRRHIEVGLDCALDRGMTTLDRMRIAVEKAGRKIGLGVMKQLLRERDPSTGKLASLHEQKVQELLRASRVLPPATKQYLVELPDGQRRRLDFAYPDARLGVECQPYGTHGPDKHEDDMSRHNALTEADWLILYWTPRKVAEAGRNLLRQLEGTYISRVRSRSA